MSATIDSGLYLDPNAPSSRHLEPDHIIALTTRQAAEVLGVCERTIQNLVAGKHLRVLKIGRSSRILSDELLEFARKGTSKIKDASEVTGAV